MSKTPTSSSTHEIDTLTDPDVDSSPLSESRASGLVLLVGDSRLLREVAARLREAGISTHACHAASDAIDIMRSRPVWVSVVLDYFDDGTAFDVAMSSCGTGTDMILLYSPRSIPDVIRAIRSGSEVRLFPQSASAEAVAVCCTDLYSKRAAAEARRSDRRAFPRFLPEAIRIENPPMSELIDLAPGGLAFRSEASFDDDSQLEVALRIGRAATLRLAGRVVRQTRDNLDRNCVALQFVAPPERAQRILLGVARRHLATRGLRDMQRRFREGSSSDVVPIARRERIEAFLVQAMNEGLSLTIQSATGGIVWQSSVLSVSSHNSAMEIRVPPASFAIAPGQTLDILLVHEFESYLFDVTLVDVGVTRFVCELPRVIYYSEKRSRIRHHLPLAEQLMVRVRDPRRHDGWLSFPLLELSSMGASFLADLNRALILPGSVFDPVLVTAGDTQILKERGEVRHVTATPESGDYKVGLRFTRDTGPLRRVAEPSLRFTLDNAPATTATSRSQLLRFTNLSGEELVALLNKTSGMGDFSGPVVLILPSWGHSKESFCGYALSLIENFERVGAPLAVLRIDYSHHKGQSYVPTSNRASGRESLGFTFSHALDDAQSAIEFCHNNPIFTPTSLTLVAPSFNGQLALRLAATESRIGHLILPTSTPATRELMKNASGGVDYVGEARRGHRFGQVDFLGLLVDMDAVTADAIRNRLAFLSDAEDDIRRISARVTWLIGRHDAWIDENQVAQLLRHAAHSTVELVVVESGHIPTRDESVLVATEVTRAVMDQHGLETTDLVVSSPDRLDLLQRDEWDRAPRTHLSSHHDYWQGYLLGETNESLGYEILAFTDAYQDFAAVQLELLDPRYGQTALDAGAGTGQLAARLLESTHPLPQCLELVDLVPSALGRARRRLERCSRAAELELSWRSVDLQVSQLTPVRRFIDGEYPSISSLRGRISGLTNEIIECLEAEYRSPLAPLLHRAIRGERAPLNSLKHLDQTTFQAVVELGRAARLLRNTLVVADLDPKHALEGRLLLARGGAASFSTRQLAFGLLDFGDSGAPQQLPFVSDKYDRILCSLVLPYLRNPDETLSELVRALRPGGRIVVSTMKPDTDISKLQEDLVHKVNSGTLRPPTGFTLDRILAELRCYANSAGRLLRLTEEGTFNFLRSDELRTLLENVELTDISIRACFGNPTQAFVASGTKPPAASP